MCNAPVKRIATERRVAKRGYFIFELGKMPVMIRLASFIARYLPRGREK
jgi:hypothetical protein